MTEKAVRQDFPFCRSATDVTQEENSPRSPVFAGLTSSFFVDTGIFVVSVGRNFSVLLVVAKKRRVPQEADLIRYP